MIQFNNYNNYGTIIDGGVGDIYIDRQHHKIKMNIKQGQVFIMYLFNFLMTNSVARAEILACMESAWDREIVETRNEKGEIKVHYSPAGFKDETKSHILYKNIPWFVAPGEYEWDVRLVCAMLAGMVHFPIYFSSEKFYRVWKPAWKREGNLVGPPSIAFIENQSVFIKDTPFGRWAQFENKATKEKETCNEILKHINNKIA